MSPVQAPKCPKCGGPATPKTPYSPFCSKRCQLADLDVWLKEGYRVPAAPSLEEEEGDPQPNMNGPLEES
ncbi:MAG: DNA gyrase inhibitor YacG [Myxococcota bacterium]